MIAIIGTISATTITAVLGMGLNMLSKPSKATKDEER
jgi:hypothetical protein